MDQKFVDSLNVMEIDVVIIKGKIPGIKKQVELIMDKKTFQEWREKVKTPKIEIPKTKKKTKFLEGTSSSTSSRNRETYRA